MSSIAERSPPSDTHKYKNVSSLFRATNKSNNVGAPCFIEIAKL